MPPRSRSEFEIAIICSLPLEVDAVEALFDEHYDELDHLYGKQPGDANIYKTGRIGRHHVVLVYMPDMGYRSSASVTSGLRISFTGIKLALVVGICGGVPYAPERSEIILGDVIISDGVVEYDFGKQYPNRFERKRHMKEVLGRPNQEIRAFLSRLQTRRMKNQMQEKVAQYLHYLHEDGGDEWHYPGSSRDILFEASYRHKHYQQNQECICSKCCSSGDPVCEQALKASCEELGCSGKLVQRERLIYTDSPRPIIHIGLIASANTVMKSGEHRDQLGKTEKVIGFEMEGPGVWDGLPCLIIKGVCDYADSHKNNIWQKYAAATAACCTKAFLEYWIATVNEELHQSDFPSRLDRHATSDNQKALSVEQGNQPVSGQSQKRAALPVPEEADGNLKRVRHGDIPHVDLTQSTEHNDRDIINSGPSEQPVKATSDSTFRSSKPALTPEQRKEYLNLLKFEQIESRHATIRAAHTKTCRWLLNKREYQEWFDAENLPEHHGLLWIKGNPGTGKSTIVKFAFTNETKNARLDRSVVVISFFFNARGEELEKSVVGMYRSLLVQLLEKATDLHDSFDSMRLTTPNENEIPVWDVETLKTIFRSCVEKLGSRSLICFIDALDECSEDEVREMVAFFEELAYLATSCQLRFRVCFSSRHYPYIRIEKGIELILDVQDGHDQDIANYVHSELKAGREVDTIKEEVIKKSSGIFLWVVLVIPILNKEYAQGRMRALRKRLQEIPKGLDKLFISILTKDDENIEELILCLQWILFSRRPLKREELYFALLAGVEPQAIEARDSHEDTQDVMERYILNASKGLAEVTKASKSQSQTVQFIHESVRDFLLNGGFGRILPNLKDNIQGQSHERLKECCLNYMSADFSRYIDAQGFITREFSPPGANYAEGSGISQTEFLLNFPRASWVVLDNLFEKFEIRRHTANVSLLYVLAEGNLANLIQIHPSKLSYLAVEDERYGPPLFAALATGSYDAVRAFLDAHESSRYLLSQFPDTFHKDTKTDKFTRDFKFLKRRGITSLLYEFGNNILVDCVLSAAPHLPNSNFHQDCTAGSWTTEKSDDTLVKLLLDTGKFNIDSNDYMGRAPLSWAAINGFDAIFKALLETGKVNPNSESTNRRTPLSYAAEQGNKNLVKLLLDTGMVDVDSQDDYGRTPLSWAAINGSDTIVKALLETGKVNPDSKDINDRTPLSWATIYGSDTIVKALLETGKVDVNSQDVYRRTPLSYSAKRGNQDMVRLLLEAGEVDIYLQDVYGQTPLSYAAEHGNNDLVRLLIGTDKVAVNPKDIHGRTPLTYAAECGNRELMKILLNIGKVNIAKWT